MSDKINWNMCNNINFRMSKIKSKIIPPPAAIPLSRVQKDKNMQEKPVSDIPISDYAPPKACKPDEEIKDNMCDLTRVVKFGSIMEKEENYLNGRWNGQICQEALNGFSENKEESLKYDDVNFKLSPYSFAIGLCVAFLIIAIAAMIYPPCQ